MWKPLKMTMMLIPAALMLMSFDVSREETDLDMVPPRALFGEYGDSPDPAALRDWVLVTMGCLKAKAASAQSYTKPMMCRLYRLGHFTTASAGQLHVVPLGPQPLNGQVGLQCYEGIFGHLLDAKGKPLKDHGLRYSQYCMANGWAYELSMEVYYGLDT